MKNNYYRRIEFYGENDILHSEYYDIREQSYISNVYKLAKRLSYMYKEDITIVALDSEELYETDRIYIYYEDVIKDVEDWKTELKINQEELELVEQLTDERLGFVINMIIASQQALYDITGRVYDCFADKE